MRRNLPAPVEIGEIIRSWRRAMLDMNSKDAKTQRNETYPPSRLRAFVVPFFPAEKIF
jgi:hypothetical protein